MPYDLSGSGRSVCRKWCPWPKVTHFSWLPLVLDLSTCTRYTHQRVGPPQAGTGPWFAWVTFIRPGSVSPGTSCFVHTQQQPSRPRITAARSHSWPPWKILIRSCNLTVTTLHLLSPHRLNLSVCVQILKQAGARARFCFWSEYSIEKFVLTKLHRRADSWNNKRAQ